MRRPLLFMRKRSLLGSFLGKHAGVAGLSKSVGAFYDPVIGEGLESPAGTAFILDTITDGDGTLLEDHVISPVNIKEIFWVKENIKQRDIQTGKIALTGLVDPDGIENDFSLYIGESKLTISADAKSLSTGIFANITLIVRFVDANNYIGVRWNQFHPILTSVDIIEAVNGSISVLKAISTDNSYQQTEQSIEVIDDGLTIIAKWANEAPVQVRTTKFNTATKVGVKNGLDPLATWDNVAVSKTSTELLIHDDFVDTDTTVLSAHTISPVNLYAKSWVKDNTYDLTIVGDKLTSAGLDTVAEKENDHIIDLGITDVTIEAGIQFSGWGASLPILSFLMARYQDSSNHVAVVLQAIDSAPDLVDIEIRELTANVHTVLASASLDPSVIFDYMIMKLVDTGDELIAYLDGVEMCRADYTRLNDQTKIGIKTQSETCTYEYLKAWNTPR